jgi:hypothetical protein
MLFSTTWTSHHTNNNWIVDYIERKKVPLNYFEREVTVHVTIFDSTYTEVHFLYTALTINKSQPEYTLAFE